MINIVIINKNISIKIFTFGLQNNKNDNEFNQGHTINHYSTNFYWL